MFGNTAEVTALPRVVLAGIPAFAGMAEGR